jgi:hypothetical protein
LRVSHGITGNSPYPGQGGPYDIIAVPADGANPLNREFGLDYVLKTPKNDKLTWEKTRTWNVGFSFAMFNNRFSGQFDIYHKKTTGLLAYNEIDPTYGHLYTLQNIGEMTNKGFEFTLGSRNILTPDFTWDTELMMSYNKNKIEKMYFEPIQVPYALVYEEYAEGYAAGALFAFQWAGLDPEDGAARIYNSDGTIIRDVNAMEDKSAVKYMGTVVPVWSGSLTNTFRYKNLELSFMFITNMGHKMRNDGYTSDMPRIIANMHNDFDKRWRKPGDEAYTNIPSYISLDKESERTGGTQMLRYSDVNVLDAGYIKLRELSLAYYLPKSACKAINAESMKVRLQATNLWTIAFNKEGVDPEAFSLRNGARYDRYKPTVSASISINF